MMVIMLWVASQLFCLFNHLVLQADCCLRGEDLWQHGNFSLCAVVGNIMVFSGISKVS